MVITPPWILVVVPHLIFTFSLVTPVGLDALHESEVTVTIVTDEGVGSETLTLQLLPF